MSSKEKRKKGNILDFRTIKHTKIYNIPELDRESSGIRHCDFYYI